MLVNNAARVDGKGFVVHDGKGFGKQFKPTIPLEKVQVEYLKANYVIIKIKTIPEDAASPLQEVQMPYFKDGTPDQTRSLRLRSQGRGGFIGFGR